MGVISPNMRLRDPLPMAVAAMVATRALVFLYACIFIVTNEAGDRVSPLVVQSGMDFSFYVESSVALQGGITGLIEHFGAMIEQPISRWGKFMISGPILPLVIAVFDYGPGNTLPLTISYLGLSIALGAVWLVWLHGRGLPRSWLLLFAVIPNPIWFMLNVSTDLLFAAVTAVFVYYYFSERDLSVRFRIGAMIAILALLIRPNAIALVAFVMIDFLIQEWGRLRGPHRYVFGAVTMIAMLAAVTFYFPYFLAFVVGSNEIDYFGVPQHAYLDGLIPSLPAFLDIPLGVVTLAGAKCLYFAGLRPSYADVGLGLVVIRSAIGLVLLPGMFYALIKAPLSMRLFLAIYMAPIFLGAAQDRYNFPIQAILILYGAMAYRSAFNRLRADPKKLWNRTHHS